MFSIINDIDLNIRKVTASVADSDIKVYKVLGTTADGRFVERRSGAERREGDVIKSDRFDKVKNAFKSGRVTVAYPLGGIESYGEEIKGKDLGDGEGAVIAECRIPKGARYFEGLNCGIKAYSSSELVFDRISPYCEIKKENLCA